MSIAALGVLVSGLNALRWQRSRLQARWVPSDHFFLPHRTPIVADLLACYCISFIITLSLCPTVYVSLSATEISAVFVLSASAGQKRLSIVYYVVHIHAQTYKFHCRFNSDWLNCSDLKPPCLILATESVSIFQILSALLHNAYPMLASQQVWPCVWVRLCISNTLIHSLLTGVFILGLSDDIWHINDRIWPHMLD